MMCDPLIESITSKLTAAGFTVKREYVGDIADVGSSSFPAFLRVEKIELRELIQTRSDERTCREEVTLRIRALGRDEGFYGASALADKTENAVARIYLSENMLVKDITCGEIKKNTALGRLEQVIGLTAVTTLSMGGA